MTDKTIPEMARELNALICSLCKQTQLYYAKLLSQAKRHRLINVPPSPHVTPQEFWTRARILTYLRDTIKDDMMLQQVATYMTSLRKDVI